MTLMTLTKLKLNQGLSLSLSLFHLSTCYLHKKFDDLEVSIIAITETRIKSNMNITT